MQGFDFHECRNELGGRVSALVLTPVSLRQRCITLQCLALKPSRNVFSALVAPIAPNYKLRPPECLNMFKKCLKKVKSKVDLNI